MRFSEAWLREWVNPDVDTRTLADQLTMAGLEVDAVEPAAPEFSDVLVGQVRAVEAHPNAEKLRLCRVDVGSGGPLQIICGAANVAADMKVPVAMLGARLPGDLEIKRARLRGVESLGMICAANELGLAESSEGILPLPADAPVGADLRSYLDLDDWCIALDLTPDRADCLSLAGVSREVGAINRSPVQGPLIEPVPPRNDDCFPVRLEAPEACPSYVCRVVRDIDPDAVTPLWMQERLRRSGLRSIGPVVDVTNYVLLELGQPLHGFDLDRLDGAIRVRMAMAGERLLLLNGEELALRDDTLVIADRNRPVALAGIMGGAETGVTTRTRHVLLESAFFAPRAISGRARSYGLHTDSSHRFERGVDPELQARAVERATALLLDIVGGRPGPVAGLNAEEHLPRRKRLRLRRERIGKVLGTKPADAAVEDIFTRLGIRITPASDGWDLVPPSSRFDLQLEVDLIAEIGRIQGYEQIPVTHAGAAATIRALPETAFDLDRARLALVARGYHEVITYSFVSPELQHRIDPRPETLTLSNPLSLDMSVMRTSLWPGLVQTARQNQARRQERVRIFESGLCFLRIGDKLEQNEQLAGLVVGFSAPVQWGMRVRPVDFYGTKADLEAVLGLTGNPERFRFLPAAHPALHPGQTACIEHDGRKIGMLGMLHPALAAELDIKGNAFLFEVALAELQTGPPPAFEPPSRFPAIRRDLAIVVAAEVTYDQVRECAASAASDLLQDLVLFDVYQGPEIDSGKKSLAFGLILQASSRTLTDREVDATISRVLAQIKSELGAKLRD
ncbi:phenylalanine--tRNA ligase subunit beta [Candidatus Thiosymbion oneisti]|uniref:phenylalanine--tRNA ligase subunit beta n=1 Tax=Candidatus Thiosymbion oneisti TaxID=589554 RepID=UPI000A5DEFCF|nr:phenylalanine--tRNA ligase subunit beta [Candidatus Thiosymbion oneisti]